MITRTKIIWASVATIAVIVSGIGGINVIVGNDGNKANIWIDTTGGTCTREVTPKLYEDGNACGTFDAAYQLAASGDIIRVAAGTYSFQQIQDSSPNKTSTVLFTPATNDTVVDVAGIDINGADWVTLRLFRNTQNQTPFSIDDDGAGNSPDNITFEDLDGPWFDVLDDNATGILISGGDYGPCDANAGNDNQGCTARMLGTGTTVDGATIHNITTTDATNFHVDGVFIRGCIDCVVRNSTFYNNQIQNIRIQNCCSLPDNDGTQIYNNWFGFAWSNEDLTGLRHGAIDVDNAVPDMVIAFNSFASSCEGGGTCAAYPSGVTSGTPTNPALIYGNLTGRTNASCTTDTNFSYNVYKKFGPTNGVSCDATEVLSNDPFPYVSDPVTSGAIDFNITGATWSGDELVPASLCDDYPADKNGNRSRNDGNGCDAGALER